MVIDLHWSEIILVIANQTYPVHMFDFETMNMISDQIALCSVQLPLYINYWAISRDACNKENG